MKHVNWADVSVHGSVEVGALFKLMESLRPHGGVESMESDRCVESIDILAAYVIMKVY